MYFVHIFAYVLYSNKEKLKTSVESDSKSVHMKKKKEKKNVVMCLEKCLN